MFQNAVTSQSADDKFTDWCTRTLQGLNASIDGRCWYDRLSYAIC